MLQIKCTLYVTIVHETSVHYSANWCLATGLYFAYQNNKDKKPMQRK